MRESLALQKIDTIAQMLCQFSRDLWEHPEVAFTEYYASDRLKAILRENGFELEENVGGLPTAFLASYGSGAPRIALLAEYDALPGFSQKTQTSEEPEVPGAPGHACGHNLMAAAHLGAALAVKAAMGEGDGTLIFCGCPAEEVLTGKVFMARAGAFDGIDCAINFHPNAVNGVEMHQCAGINNIKFNFHGTVSHAAARPYDGRSASDAVELMNVGANYLREHIPDGVRVHYVTTAGGRAPNIVPNFAQSWYHVRARTRAEVDEVCARLLDVARGAALMTGTRLEVDFQGGCSPTVPNHALARLVDAAMRELGAPEYTEEELAYAAQLNASCPPAPRRPYPVDPSTAVSRAFYGLYDEGGFIYNATDIGDVSLLLPTVMFGTACYNFLADLHSWQVAACTGHSIGQKGMLFAARIMALSAARLFADPALVQQAKAEHAEAVRGVEYVCPIPAKVRPPVVPRPETAG